MVIYQIYPRSFYDSNNDGIGDLTGIEKKLGYIKSLGVDAIWICPFFMSPNRDFGYDVSDYRKIDPQFGTMDDFKRMMASANALGLSVIVDMVASHTSNEHSWFEESRRRSTDKNDWYVWADPKPDGTPPNNWTSRFGGPGWEWDATRCQYFFHTFLVSQPDLNMHAPALQEQVLSEMKFWLDLGVAGFRLDAATHIFQDALLRDNPPVDNPKDPLRPYTYQDHIYDQNRPELLAFFSRITDLLKHYHGYTLAEIGGDSPLGKMSLYTRAGRLDAAYSYAFMGENASAGYLRNAISVLEETVDAPGRACYAFSNHDKQRVASRWRHGRNMADNAKAMLALLATMRGDICLYQGEELGLPESDVPRARLQDPIGINYWPHSKGRDGCRTPMPWTAQLHGGFSETAPWLPVDDAHLPLSVSEQEGKSDSTLNFTRMIFAARRANDEFRLGSLTMRPCAEGLLAFSRSTPAGEILCIFNLEMHDLSYALTTPGVLIAQQYATSTEHGFSLGVSGFCITRIR